MIDTLLAGNLLDKKDIKINQKNDKLKIGLFCLYLIAIGLFVFYLPKQGNINTYFQSGIMLIVCLNLIVKMLRNSVFLNHNRLKKGFLEKDKKGVAKVVKG
jgi:hypothetical protein